MDWTNSKTKSPFDVDYTKYIYNHLKSIRMVLNGTYTEYRNEQIKNKRVLDIGVCEHDLEHINSPEWKHAQICKLSSYCVGIDLDKEMVDELIKRGYNIKLVDATSDEYIGEKFDVIIIGDVIEHVDNPVKLLRFAKRHLSENGKIIATTPNPFFLPFVLTNLLKGTFMALAEHTCWITTTNAVEIARRADLKLDRYLFFKRSKYAMQTVLKFFLPAESINSYFVYEFKHK